VREARLAARPGDRETDPRAPGLRRLDGGLLHVPAGYAPERPAPLVVLLHGAGSSARAGLGPLLDLADDAGLVLLAPEAHGSTWDVIVADFGPDVARIDALLAETFARLAIDPARLAIGGFSDGASYALSLGIANGDLFSHLVAFAPGFVAPAAPRGRPRIFVSHGAHDAVLPIGRCSRRLVPALRRAGYEVRYDEFDGAHVVPRAVARDAVRWLLDSG
jgi:phospholipase/carboxylesterase